MTHHRDRTWRWSIWCLSGAIVLCSSTAFAQRPDRTTELAAAAAIEQGREAYAAGEYQTALELLDSAYSAKPSAFAALWSARAMVKLGRYLEASARYREATTPELWSGTQPRELAARYVARREHPALLRQIPVLAVRVDIPCDTRVYIRVDGKMPPSARQGVLQQVDPGRHVVVGYCGGQMITREVDLAPGDRLSIALRFRGTPEWEHEYEDTESSTPTDSRHLPALGQEPPPANPYCDSPFATPLTSPCVPRESLEHRRHILEIENPYATESHPRRLPATGQESPPANPYCDSPFATSLANPCVPRARFAPLQPYDSILEIENPYPDR